MFSTDTFFRQRSTVSYYFFEPSLKVSLQSALVNGLIWCLSITYTNPGKYRKYLGAISVGCLKTFHFYFLSNATYTKKKKYLGNERNKLYVKKKGK